MIRPAKRPPRPARVRRRLFRLPLALFRARLGWLFGGRLVCVEHVGRRTGRHRRVVLEVVTRDRVSGGFVVASGFGAGADWYRNLRAHPRTAVTVGLRRVPVIAHQLPAERAAAVMVEYGHAHPWLARRIARFMGFVVDGTDEDYSAVGRSVPFLLLASSAAGRAD